MYFDEWIIENYHNYKSTKALCIAYNEKFGTDYGYNTFKSHCNRELRKNGERSESILYTEEQNKWLEENYYKYGKYCLEEFNKLFGTERTIHALVVHCKRNNYKVNKDVANAHQLKNTNREHEIGDIWKDSSTGFWMIKVAKVSNNQYESIKRYHRYVWEKANGIIPDKHKVIFLDGNVDNCELNNLACIPSSYLVLLNKHKLKSEHPKITETALKWCELYVKEKNNGN